MHSSIGIARFALLFVLVSAAVAKAVEPALIFSDQMVLQRDVSVPIWGRAEPGEQVTVSFAGQSKKATADAEGLWRAELDALPASAQPRTMTLQGKGDAVTLDGVLVGDVWLFSGDIIGLGYYQGRFEKGSRMGIYYDINPFIKQDQAGGRLPIIRTFVAAPAGRDRHALRPQYRFDIAIGFVTISTTLLAQLRALIRCKPAHTHQNISDITHMRIVGGVFWKIKVA